MSRWLFNVYMDGVVREVKAEMLERGVKLRMNGKLDNCCLQMILL